MQLFEIGIWLSVAVSAALGLLAVGLSWYAIKAMNRESEAAINRFERLLGVIGSMSEGGEDDKEQFYDEIADAIWSRIKAKQDGQAGGLAGSMGLFNMFGGLPGLGGGGDNQGGNQGGTPPPIF